MKRILVVDDDPFTCELVSQVLGDGEHVVVTSQHGKDALERLKKERFDLIILDIVMPEIDGWEVIREIRANGSHAFLPVIFLTGMNAEEDRIRGFKLGADDYLEKPFNHDELRLRVKRMLLRAEQVGHPMHQTLALENGFQGSLEDFGLAPLLTLLAMENKTGPLHIRHMGLLCTFYLQDGRILYARRQDDSGINSYECIYEALAWGGGTFHFVSTQVEGDDEIQQSTSQLLLEIAREMDERRGAQPWQEN